MNLLQLVLGLAMVAGLAYLVYIMISDRIGGGRAEEAGRPQRDEPMPTPDFDGLERHFGTNLPDDVRWLYDESGLTSQRELERASPDDPDDTYRIAHFLPATVDSVRGVWFDIGRDRFPFAVDVFDNYLAVDLGPEQRGQVVYIDHDGGESWTVAKSLREFLR